MTERTKGEQEFIDQMARSKMVEYCSAAVISGTGTFSIQQGTNPYVEHAVSKKWVALSGAPSGGWQGYKVLSAGWDTAARFLKR